MKRRWRIDIGIDGVVRPRGLDASQIEPVLRLMGMKRKERERVWDGLLVMEEAALAAFYGNGDHD